MTRLQPSNGRANPFPLYMTLSPSSSFSIPLFGEADPFVPFFGGFTQCRSRRSPTFFPPSPVRFLRRGLLPAQARVSSRHDFPEPPGFLALRTLKSFGPGTALLCSQFLPRTQLQFFLLNVHLQHDLQHAPCRTSSLSFLVCNARFPRPRLLSRSSRDARISPLFFFPLLRGPRAFSSEKSPSLTFFCPTTFMNLPSSKT